MGRPAKPTDLKKLEGNLGKRKLPENEPKPAGNLSAPPSYLGAEEKKEWKFLIKNAPFGLLKHLDTAVLEIFVIARIQHRIAVRELASEGQNIETSNGNIIQNPRVGVMNRQAEIMLKAASQMGFTPASRSKVSVDPEEKASGFAEFED